MKRRSATRLGLFGLGLLLVTVTLLNTISNVLAEPDLPTRSRPIHIYPDMNGTAIVGVVFQDWDQDGERDQEEPGLAGAKVTLYNVWGEEVTKTETAVDGLYAFDSLEPGEYTLVETDPFGYSTLASNKASVRVEADEVAVVDFGDVLLLCGDCKLPAKGSGRTFLPHLSK